MEILILGGTRFVGRHIVEVAQGRGHHVTLFNRGLTNPGLFPGAEELHGDRDGQLQALEGRSWDAVVDTCGYVPRVVRASAERLVDATAHYTFISTISVYADPLPPEADEQAPLAIVSDPAVEEVTAETYGGLKALCEQVVRHTYQERALIVRPGLIVGPQDPTDRFTYWPVRVARGGQVLAPGESRRPVQFIDARDLAAWIVQMVEAGSAGVYNATGPRDLLTMGAFLDSCRDAVASDASLTWVGDDFLLEKDVEPFTTMPLWILGDEGLAYGTVDRSAAVREGLSFRPLQQTIWDTLTWANTRPDEYEWRAGLSPQREKELLLEWHKAPEPGEGADQA